MPQFKRVRLINPRKRSRRRATRNASGQFVKRTKRKARKTPFRQRRRNSARARRRNVMGFVDAGGSFHPIRASGDYSPRRAGESRKKKVSRRPGARPRKKNPLGEELILLSNPRRKKNSHRRRSRRAALPTRRRRSNPFRGFARSRRRRNPVNTGSVKGFAIEGVKAIAAGAVGAVGTRAIVQGILGDKNVGMMGYLSNLAVALGGGFALWKFTKSKSIALGWAVGGAANTVQRIWSEKVSMTSPAAAAPQLSDLDYSSNGLGGVGLSGFVNTGFALPSVTDGGGVVQAPFQPQLPAATAAAGSNAGPGATLNIPNAQVNRFQPRY